MSVVFFSTDAPPISKTNVSSVPPGTLRAFEGQTLMVGFGWWGYAEIMVSAREGQALTIQSSDTVAAVW